MKILTSQGRKFLSMEGRMEESENPDIYELVYSNRRPELFFKSNSRRSSSPDGKIYNLELYYNSERFKSKYTRTRVRFSN